MSMSGDDAYVLAMDYVDETLEGGGALKGDDGKSAYQSWLDLGNTGTEEDFINSLKGEKGQVGEKGETGNNGKSSYEIWLDNGNVGTEQDFLDSLKGEGTDGFSPVITENSNNTDEYYRLDIETKESKFTTPNLKADISKNIAEHNTSPDSHNDIRIFLNELNNRLNALANSDDETLDEMKEVVAYIKDNRSLIESITTTKVNVADIIDNLTTNISNKPLSASQGVVIKNLIDTLQSELTAHINNADIHVTASDKTNWNNATDKINNLEVGGRNLIDGIYTYGFLNNVTVTDDNKIKIDYSSDNTIDCYFLVNMHSNFVLGEEYTISFDVENLEGDAHVYIGIPDNVIELKNGRVYKTFVASEGIAHRYANQLLIDNVLNSVTSKSNNILLSNFKLEKGNVATDWTPAPEDLQPIADNSQFCNSTLTTQGWYRIAEYNGCNVSDAMGVHANSCEIILKRTFNNCDSESHKIILQSKYMLQKFASIYSVSGVEKLFYKIRYVYDSTKAYIDVYYGVTQTNSASFTLKNGKDNTFSWKAITPILVAESTEGETVSTVFDIPSNANPVTDLDLKEHLHIGSPIYPTNIELKPPSNVNHGGFIDFHFNSSEEDYTSRIIETEAGELDINGLKVKNGKASGMLATINVPTNYIYDVIGDKEGNIHYGEGVGVVNLRVDFFTTYEIEASKILAIYVEADKKLKGFVWDPLIESQVISGNTLYSFEIKDINSNSGSVAVTSCKLLYMV